MYAVWLGVGAVTALEAARAVARSYRDALHTADPVLCAHLDERARDRGHGWWLLQPADIPADLVDDALDALLSAPDIEHFCGVSSRTVRSWDRRGLLGRHAGPDGSPRYRVREVLAVEARNRR